MNQPNHYRLTTWDNRQDIEIHFKGLSSLNRDCIMVSRKLGKEPTQYSVWVIGTEIVSNKKKWLDEKNGSFEFYDPCYTVIKEHGEFIKRVEVI